MLVRNITLNFATVASAIVTKTVLNCEVFLE